jgi:hypothetical protein
MLPGNEIITQAIQQIPEDQHEQLVELITSARDNLIAGTASTGLFGTLGPLILNLLPTLFPKLAPTLNNVSGPLGSFFTWIAVPENQQTLISIMNTVLALFPKKA